MAIDPITAGIGLVDKFIGKFVKDKDLAAKLRAEATSETFQGEIALLLGQIEINKEEAKSEKWWKAGWRPFIGWTCGVALAAKFVLFPILQFLIIIFMTNPVTLPVIGVGELMPVLLGMLGLGAMRSYEKKGGVQ